MLLIKEALKITSVKVLLSFVNIIVFQNLLGLVKYVAPSGIISFFIAIYLMGKIRPIMYRVLFALNPMRLFWRRAAKSSSSSQPASAVNLVAFNAVEISDRELDSVVVEEEEKESDEQKEAKLKRVQEARRHLADYVQQQGHGDLFAFVYNCACQRAFIQFMTLIMVEYVHATYGCGLVRSVAVSVLCSFCICFGASFGYSSILFKEWSLSSSSEAKERSFVIYMSRLRPVSSPQPAAPVNAPDAESLLESPSQPPPPPQPQPVATEETSRHFSCLAKMRKSARGTDEPTHFEMRYVCAELDGYKHLLVDFLLRSFAESADHSNKAFSIVVPDYYDAGAVVTSVVKQRGFKCDRTWTEYKVLPNVSLNAQSYTNRPLADQNKKNN